MLPEVFASSAPQSIQCFSFGYGLPSVFVPPGFAMDGFRLFRIAVAGRTGGGHVCLDVQIVREAIETVLQDFPPWAILCFHPRLRGYHA